MRAWRIQLEDPERPERVVSKQPLGTMPDYIYGYWIEGASPIVDPKAREYQELIEAGNMQPPEVRARLVVRVYRGLKFKVWKRIARSRVWNFGTVYRARVGPRARHRTPNT